MKLHGLGQPARARDAEWRAQGAEVARTPRRTIAAAIVVAIVLAFAEREMAGTHAGSLHSLLAPYFSKVLAHQRAASPVRT
jgi:hypothetical protein